MPSTETRDAVSQIRSDLPGDIRRAGAVSKLSTSGRVVEIYSVRLKPGASWDEEQLSWYVDNTLNKRMLGVKGVGAVKRIGGVHREVQLLLQPDRIAGARRDGG